MKTDYDYVIKAIRNKGNKLIHYPALKKLISLFIIKWDSNKSKRYEVYLHSLNINLKRSFR
jgi:hypothetical protein